MTEADVVEMIGDILTEIDKFLKTSALNAQPAQWQLVMAQRKVLDDQQLRLVQTIVDDDDVEFKTQAALIDTANGQLEALVTQINKVDEVIKTISQVSASVDAILKLVA